MSKRYFRMLVVGVAVLFLISGGCAKSTTTVIQTAPESETGLTTERSDAELKSTPRTDAGFYLNETYRFSLRVPADWELKEGALGPAVIALSPQDGPDDTFRENVNVMLDDPISFKTAEEYLTASLDGMGRLLTDFVEVERASETINGNGVVWIVYEHRMGTLNLKALALFAVRGSRGYVVTCSSSPQSFSSHEPVFKEIVSSFAFE